VVEVQWNSRYADLPGIARDWAMQFGASGLVTFTMGAGTLQMNSFGRPVRESQLVLPMPCPGHTYFCPSCPSPSFTQTRLHVFKQSRKCCAIARGARRISGTSASGIVDGTTTPGKTNFRRAVQRAAKGTGRWRLSRKGTKGQRAWSQSGGEAHESLPKSRESLSKYAKVQTGVNTSRPV
jgi:hypothetical protein